MLDTLRRYEPESLHSQPPVVWHSARGATVFGSRGRSWLDWTSGILVANAGHATDAVVDAICAQARQGLIHAYAFPTMIRARFVRALATLTGFAKIVLFTTGAEAVEASIKMTRSHAIARGRGRALVICFDEAFHGRTMGAQLAGGLPEQHRWMGSGEGIFVRVPFPGRGQDWATEELDAALARVDAGPGDVASVIVEYYQGKNLRVLDTAAARRLRTWCTTHEVALIFDEVQSGFGRTGALFGHVHVGVRPDLVVCGKGLSGSLPVSAILLDDSRYAAAVPDGALTATHSANPVALAAAEANLRLFEDGQLVRKARLSGKFLADGLQTWAREDPGRRRYVAGAGMVSGFTVLDDEGTANSTAAQRLVDRCADEGLLLCSPVGMSGTLIKAMPPLSATAAELEEGLATLTAASTRDGRRSRRRAIPVPTSPTTPKHEERSSRMPRSGESVVSAVDGNGRLLTENVLRRSYTKLLALNGYVHLVDVPEGFDYVRFLRSFGDFLPDPAGMVVGDLVPDPATDDVYHSGNTRALFPHTGYDLDGLPPRYLALWCIVPPTGDGGETTLRR